MRTYPVDGHRTTPLSSEKVAAESCTFELRLALLGRVPFFASLSPTDIVEVNRSFQARDFEVGKFIYRSGDEASRLYVLLDGKVKLVRHTLAGQDVLLDMLGPGEFFGTLSALGDDEYPDTAQAQTACCVIGVESADFRSIMLRYPPVALAVLETVQQRLRDAHDVVRQLSAHTAEARVAATLLKLVDQFGETQGNRILIQTPLSRQDLAEMAGTTLETASRVISQFRRRALIASGRQWIAILNRKELEALAEGW